MTSNCNKYIFQVSIVLSDYSLYFVLISCIFYKLGKLPIFKITRDTSFQNWRSIDLKVFEYVWIALLLSKQNLCYFRVGYFFFSKISYCRVKVKFSPILNHVVLSSAFYKACSNIEVFRLSYFKQLQSCNMRLIIN